MPRYFFHLHLKGVVQPDPKGEGLRDPDQAWEFARAVALDEMQMRFEPSPEWFNSYVEVKDEAGEIVLEFPFTEALDHKGPSH